ncbi:hypothetical protein SMSP2_01450 [Limihaloglobus sulfuriphilus]|uniref:Uncharacterized protein n=1 Tax=Limihaloglobus sulfuriphilus TaxID=1851148 RepID=A0A1Q2MEF8_9BACT|nr:hypothetical protein [Limihaloglobus sulfuriphilus]AQQ71086.1 hypothetical protein SMSP2_01450 [Limihaloglobus sulfuriphilus]
MGIAGIIIVAVLNIPLYFLIGKLIFRTWESFWEAVKYNFKPDFWSLLTGRYLEDMWAETKLFVWIALSVLCVYGEIYLINKYFFAQG